MCFIGKNGYTRALLLFFSATKIPEKHYYFFPSITKQFNFTRFVDSKHSNFDLYCCPKQICLPENGPKYSTTQGLYSNTQRLPKMAGPYNGQVPIAD